MNSDHDASRVAIVGGGLSGLVAAAVLRRNDPTIHLDVFEAAPRAGGVIHTQRVTHDTIGEILIDHGADMFATQPPAAFELCRDLGVLDQLIEPKQEGRGAMIVRRGRLVPVPDGFVLMRATKLWPMLTTPLLSWRGKLRLLLEPLIPARRDNATDRDDTHDESVGSFVRRRLGREILDRIVAPLVAGIYTADVERLSMRATMAPIYQMESRYGSLTKATLARRLSREDDVERTSSGARYGQFRAFRQGMGGLIETLLDQLPRDAVHTDRPVTAIRPAPTDTPTGRKRWILETGPDGQDDGDQEAENHAPADRAPYDHVILATPAAVAARLLAPHAKIAAGELATIESASSAIVVLTVPRNAIRRPPGAFGFVVPAIENRRILAASFASEKFAGRAPDSHMIIRVFLGGALRPDLLELDDESLIRIANEELAELIGLEPPTDPPHPVADVVKTSGSDRTESHRDTRVIRWDHAMPQYHTGHLDKVKAIREDLATLPGISLLSNAIDGVGIAPRIATATRLANQIAPPPTTTPTPSRTS